MAEKSQMPAPAIPAAPNKAKQDGDAAGRQTKENKVAPARKTK